MARRKKLVIMRKEGLTDKELQQLLLAFGRVLFRYLISHAEPTGNDFAGSKWSARVKVALQEWLRVERFTFVQFDMLDFARNHGTSLDKYRQNSGFTNAEFKKFMSQRAEQRRTERFNIPGGILGTGTGGAG